MASNHPLKSNKTQQSTTAYRQPKLRKTDALRPQNSKPHKNARKIKLPAKNTTNYC